jgi:hypothetical protein
MADERPTLRDWHRLFGLLLTDYFSGSPQRSKDTNSLLGQLFEQFRGEGWGMAYTMEDFRRDYAKRHFIHLTREEREEVLRRLPVEERLAGLPVDEIRRYLDQVTAGRKTPARKPRRKK